MGRRSACRLVFALVLALSAAGLGAGAIDAVPAAAQPTPTAPEVIAGPGPGILSLGGLTVARDGSGGLVYLATIDGVAHVFAARLVGGAWQAPVELDGGLPGTSSQPVITGTNGGVLLVAFINGGTVYVTGASSTITSWTAPQPLASGASNPALQMSTYGEAYLAFTQALPGGGDDVQADYYYGGSWAPASPETLNVTAGDDAGTGAGAPSVAAAGDGVGIVAWGEGGHIYSRRIWGTLTSVETEQDDPSSVSGWGEVSADSPDVAVGGDSSYPDIAFREVVASAGQTQSRALLTRLIAEDTEAPSLIDGLVTSASDGAGAPEVAMNEYGRGFTTVATTTSADVIATPLAASGAPGAPEAVDTPGLDPTPSVQPGIAGLTSTFLAWQQTPAPGSRQIVMRYAQDGVDLATAQVLSTPAEGPADAADGLATGGDGNGDAALAWVQGPVGQRSIVVVLDYQPPGQPSPNASGTVYTRNVHPTLSWSAAREAWGPVTYTVTLDGSPLATTTGTSLPVPATLIDGPHVWQIEAANPANETSTSGRATVFVDTQPPLLRLRLSGQPRAGQTLTLRLSYRDAPNPTEPDSQGSGVGLVSVSWGGGAQTTAAPALTVSQHVFTRAGVYRLRVTATDRAGNATTISRYIRILPAVSG